jgi:NADH/NAD ratio-sensing transcriptional regulator Rex
LKKSSRPIIPRKTIYRLSIYLRCLARLRENGIGTVSVRGAGEDVTSVRGL